MRNERDREQCNPTCLFDIIEHNDSIDSLKEEYDRFKCLRPDFDQNSFSYLYDLFDKIKYAGSLPLNKVIKLKSLLADMDTDLLQKALYDCMTTCSKKSEANILILLYQVLSGGATTVEIPPIATVHDIYNKENIDARSAVDSYKYEVYKEEINRYLTQMLEEHSKTMPPVPPPMAGSTAAISERKTELVELLGQEMEPMVKRSGAHIEVASRTMLKPAWLLKFYNDVRNIDPPSCGWELLKMEKDMCQKLYNDVINERFEEVRDQVLSTKEAETQNKSQDMPKLAMLAHCRKGQIAHVCKNISDWGRIEGDRIERLKKLYNVDLRETRGPIIPLCRQCIGGGKPLPQPFYVNPEDDPNYDPPGSTTASRLMRRLMRDDSNESDDYVLTDLETRERGLAFIAKELEPFEHLTQEELSDLVLRNCKKEYELGEATYRRRSRGRQIEDDNEKLEHPVLETDILNSAAMETGASNYSKAVTTEYKEKGHTHSPPKGYNVSREQLLTDVIVFLSTLEHLQWQFACAIDLPMETITAVDKSGDSITNPRPPLLKFTGWRFNESFHSCQLYIGESSRVNEYRKQLHSSTVVVNSPKKKKDLDKLLLFGDDPLFYLKDQEMLQQMIRSGVGLEIHFKLPGFTLPPEPSEQQKSSVFYRMSTSQPHPQLSCPYCGYIMFSHSVKAHDGESLTNPEYERAILQTDPSCPICNMATRKLKVRWTTGSRGYTEEPYPTPVEDEFGDEN